VIREVEAKEGGGASPTHSLNRRKTWPPSKGIVYSGCKPMLCLVQIICANKQRQDEVDCCGTGPAEFDVETPDIRAEVVREAKKLSPNNVVVKVQP
jgi:hypothetical protein